LISDPYAELAELAEAALTSADGADLEGLAAALARSEAIVATLPATPPASARPALERAGAAHRRLGPALRASLAETRAELDLVGRGRDAARSYAGAGAATLDRRA
jgi:hypothetical protein